jgi:hypothetical protein
VLSYLLFHTHGVYDACMDIKCMLCVGSWNFVMHLLADNQIQGEATHVLRAWELYHATPTVYSFTIEAGYALTSGSVTLSEGTFETAPFRHGFLMWGQWLECSGFSESICRLWASPGGRCCPSENLGFLYDSLHLDLHNPDPGS